MAIKFTKDPDAVLDYTLDWSAWLAAGDRITACTATAADDGVTVNTTVFTDTETTAWIEGGTAGASSDVVFHVTTDGGREDDRTITLVIKEK